MVICGFIKRPRKLPGSLYLLNIKHLVMNKCLYIVLDIKYLALKDDITPRLPKDHIK